MRIEDIKIRQRIILTEEAEIYHKKNFFNFKAGMKGTIIFITQELVLIEFDDFINGHDGNRRGSIKGKDGHCWWISEEGLIEIAKVCKRKNNY